MLSTSPAPSAIVHPVILSGGAGSRLWPLSRSLHPKQFHPVTSERTMLQETALRVQDGRLFAPLLVIAGEAHRFMVSHQLQDMGSAVDCLILEPAMRNTAPAIALAALRLAETHGPDALMLVMPSDHVVGKPGAFQDAIRAAAPFAASGSIITFGIRPDRPETGYGYIEAGAGLEPGCSVCRVAAFTEKPDAETAGAYVSGGRHLWNGGIFLMTAQIYLDNLQTHAPEILAATKKAMAQSTLDGVFIRPDADAFAASPSDSIDYAVMEKCATAAVIPVDMNWSDVGSWDALWEIGDRDPDDNATRGDVLAIDCGGSLFHVEGGPAIAACGLEDMIVVSTKDSVLVIPRKRAQDVKRLVEALKSGDGDRHSLPPVVHRPWGSYELIGTGEGYQAKRIIVQPGGSLSLQLHRHRSEHWVVVSGRARVTIGGIVSELGSNQSTYIPVGASHRLENISSEPLYLIEVQCGSLLSEDDIVRLADNYGRSGTIG